MEEDLSNTSTISRGAPQVQPVGGVKVDAPKLAAAQPEKVKVVPSLRVYTAGNPAESKVTLFMGVVVCTGVPEEVM
jgi:hypothetical protein